MRLLEYIYRNARVICQSIACSPLSRRSIRTVNDYPHPVRHYLYAGGNGIHWHFFFQMPKTTHLSTFIYDFCYCGEGNMCSCDFVPRAVRILVLLLLPH